MLELLLELQLLSLWLLLELFLAVIFISNAEVNNKTNKLVDILLINIGTQKAYNKN